MEFEKYLYRGLKKDEIEARQLIPKGILTFENIKVITANSGGSYDQQKLPPIIQVKAHIDKLPTSGVSTSTSEEIARKYAGEGYVARISRKNLEAVGIKEIVVKKIINPAYLLKPEDEEIILHWPGKEGIRFPSKIIEDVYKVCKDPGSALSSKTCI